MEFSDNLNTLTYPESFETKTGFHKIKEILSSFCLSAMGTDHVENLCFLTNKEAIESRLKETIELSQICSLHSDLPLTHYYDLRSVLEKLVAPGMYISTENLWRLSLSLHTIDALLSFFKRRTDENYPLLKKLAGAYGFDRSILKEMSSIIDEKGQIKDNASPKLSDIRKQQAQLMNKRGRLIMQIYQKWVQKGFASETGVTIRNGRHVIPVPAAYKRQVNGYVLDESSTGQTVFMEPAEMYELNNLLAELEMAERKEIIKILTDFTDLLRPHFFEVGECYYFLGLIDFIRAKALFTTKFKGVKPQIINKPHIHWLNARHPLLMLKSINKSAPVVPLNLIFSESTQIMIISGPNAGGKSVCLKTAGLLQYMFQCGIPVPMDVESECGIFQKIFIEIGDEQSLENDLSTYSSHLKNMSFFLKYADKNTLFLIDEMGTGTEPHIGGAIAEAVIEQLYNQRAYGLISTHYAALKELSNKYDGILNAAMLFDHLKLEPLYILQSGEPGSSFAFEIAAKMGLDTSLITLAKSKINSSQAGFEEYYVKVKQKDALLDNKMKAIDQADFLLNDTYQKYIDLLNELNSKKQDILAEARAEAAELLKQSNRKIEHVIKEIRENQADKEKVKAERATLNELKEEMELPPPVIIKPKEKKIIQDEKYKTAPVDTPLKKDDYVMMEGQNEVGRILDIKGKDAHVVFGSLLLKTQVQKLKKVLNYKPPKVKNAISMQMVDTIFEKKKNFNEKLDLRGKRAEEALGLLDVFIDDALLCNIKTLRVLHGKGDGILRPVVRDFLRLHSQVRTCHDELIELGGQGITVVELL